jgi:diguanylate cyclase (GGDEF)-like protein
MNLAETYISTNKLDFAIKYLNIAKKMIFNNDSLLNLGNLDTNFAKYYFAKKDYKNAIDFCLSSIKYYDTANTTYRKIDNFMLISDIFLEKKDYKNAIINLEKAYTIANGFDDYINIAKLSSKLASLYDTQNDLKNSLNYYKAYHNSISKKYSLNNKHIKEQIKTKKQIRTVELERNRIASKNIQLTKMNQKMELINNIGKEITSNLDFKHSCYKINSILKNVLAIDFLIISYINNNKKSLNYIEISNVDNTKIKLVNENTPLENTLAQWVITNNESIFSNDYRNEYTKYKKTLTNDIETVPDSVIFIPLKSKNKTIGFFSIQSLKKNVYTNDTLDFINTLSPFIAVSLENSIKSAALIKALANEKKVKTKLEKSNKQLKIYSNYDSLTNIPNRRYLFSHLKKAINLSFRENTSLTLLIIDIDYFKQYNDNYGHIKGDQCLRKISEILKISLKRKSDFIARYGGDEFIIVLPNTEPNGAITIIEEITSYLKENNLKHKHSKTSDRITLSIGAYSISGFEKINSRTFIKKADECLYFVKKNGRNGFHIANDSKQTKTND